ncbi:MAG: hypothetical protein IPN67_12690 [Bacteroidales bacterium]|nr:hypothetical protein [Bacteroidales bacterium]
MIRHIPIIILLALSSVLFAQKPIDKSPGLPEKTPSTLPKGKPDLRPDSVKAKRILRQWRLSPDFSEEVSSPVDTVFSLCNRFRLADRYSPVNATLGSYGLPFYQINFFDRITDPDKFLYSTYYPFMFVPDRALFMNTQVPFTELAWTFGGKKETAEQTFRIRHSQNVNRFLNFGLIYDIVFNLGQYNYQRAEDKTATIYSSYTREKYKLYFSIGINNILALENGGITDLSKLGQGNTREVPVNLGGVNKAQSVLKNRNIMLVQRYTLGGNKVTKADSVPHKEGLFGMSGTISHILLLDKTRRSYTDEYPASGFYDTIYKSIEYTFDTLSASSVKNSVRFDFTTDTTRKFRLGGGFGFSNEIFNYTQLFNQTIPTQSITPEDPAKWRQMNNALIGRLYNGIGEKFRWYVTGELYLSGYKAGDFNFNGEMTKSFDMKKGRGSWLITGGILNRQPSFWYTRWRSNNFIWNENMNKEFRTDIGSAFIYPGRSASIKFNYAVIKNYVDFDTAAVPSQNSGGLSVAALTVSKGLKAWKFHLDTDAVLQKSTNTEILDLPLATLRAAFYFEHLFRFKKTNGKLNTQFGVDVTYHTLYHPYAYMPATGRFYRQIDTEAGNYPFVNLFLNFKLKRTRVFLMFDHLNYGAMGEKVVNNYYMVPFYPMNVTMFRLGFAWTFYN